MPSTRLRPARGRSLLQESIRRRRRRRVFTCLAAGVLVTLVVALVSAQPGVWGVQLLIDALLVAYVAMLIRVRNVSAEAEMSARTLGE